MASLGDSHLDRVSYKACKQLGSIASNGGNYAAFMSSCLNSGYKLSINWYSAILVRCQYQYYIFDASFDPTLHNTTSGSNPIPFCIKDCPGLSLIYYLLSVLKLKKGKDYPRIQTNTGNPMKGKQLTIDQIWITGTGSTELDCQKEAAMILSQLMTRGVVLGE